MSSTKKMVKTALFAALIFIATYFIKIQTPAMGYIHPGDGLVLLSGLFLGPLHGAFAAGFGSLLADLFGGYLTYAPATFVIKALTAMVPVLLVSASKKKPGFVRYTLIFILGEAVTVSLYFVYDIVLFGLMAEGGLAAGLSTAAAELPFNLVQGLFGVVIADVSRNLQRLFREDGITPSPEH